MLKVLDQRELRPHRDLLSPTILLVVAYCLALALALAVRVWAAPLGSWTLVPNALLMLPSQPQQGLRIALRRRLDDRKQVVVGPVVVGLVVVGQVVVGPVVVGQVVVGQVVVGPVVVGPVVVGLVVVGLVVVWTGCCE